MNFVMRDVEPEEKDDGEQLQAAMNAGQDDGAEHPGEEITEESEFVASGTKKPVNQTAMMLFAILAIGGAGLYVMNKRSGPSAAHAADPRIVAAQKTISDFMQKGNTNVSMLRRLLDGTAKVIEQFKMPSVIQVPLKDLKANPFHFAGADKPATTDDGSAAARRRKEQEKLSIQNAVRSLQLQTLIVRGNRKACMINNVLYQEGEAVGDFTIESISSDGVIVKKDAYRFRLQIAR